VTDPLDHILQLARKIGPRPSTGEGERRAAAYIEGQLKGFGFGVKTEPFRSVRSFSYTYIPIFLLSVVAFIVGVGLDKPALGLLLSGIALVAFIGENTTTLHLANALVPKGKSQNVVARLGTRELPRRRLILCAHYDSARSGLMWHPALVRGFRLTFLAEVAAILALPILLGAETLTGNRLFGYIASPFAVLLAIPLFLLIHRELFFKHVDGANDNASGVGVLLSLCEALAADPPSDTEVIALATGCEEAGLVGMQRFLATHLDDLEQASIINIDNVGAGEVTYTTAEGMLLRQKTAKDLVVVAEKVAGLPGMGVVGRPFRVMSNDTEPALLRRLDAITVIATRDGVPVNWHWKTDTLENIDADTVDTAYRFVEALVRRLIA
jgi:Peptidase family M28